MVANQGRDDTGFTPGHDDDDDDHVPIVDEEMPPDESRAPGARDDYAAMVTGERSESRTPSGHMRSLPPQAPPSNPRMQAVPGLEIPPTPHRPMPAQPPSGERPGAGSVSGDRGPPQAPLPSPTPTPAPGAPAPASTPIPAASTPVPGTTTGTFERLAPGTVLDDKYVIGVKLGQGGMGAVFRARHKLLGKDVALKIIAPLMAENESFKARFSREAKVAMEFLHRHAIPLRDFGVTTTGLFYMTMDFSPGRSLRAVVEKDGALEPARACRIVSQMLDALQEAHRKHIVHRDLKPDNVMVEQDDEGKDFVKVLDFGLAKIAGGTEESGAHDPSLASGESILGTPAYMSPEQATGEEVDARTDLYSCGVVLYQLLAGELPFKANTTRQMIMKQVASAPPPLKQLKPDIVLPDGLEAVVLRSLAKERKDRYQTAEEFKSALAPYADPSLLKNSVAGSGTIPSERPKGSAEALGAVQIAVGLTIDRYKILEKIAEGGFGAVYRAEHVLMHRACAFKVMKAGLSEDEEFSTRFQREAQVASKFKHPNAVEVYDFGKVGTQLFMAMELVEGKPLTHRVRGKTGPPIVLRDAVEIMCQALDVLEAAHKAGIVHRDLKPDNIMLNVVEGWPNQVKVLDFGIAKMKGIGDAADYATQAGSFFGTPQYASPEQCRGELGIDGRSDIYSMGIILHEMLTGKLPFESETAAGFLACHMVTPPKRLRESRAELKVPDPVEQVVQKALAKAREQRFQTAREFSDALRRASGINPLFEVGDKGVRVASRRDTRPESAVVEPAKGFGLAVGVILVIVLALGFWIFGMPNTKPRGPASVRIMAGMADVNIAMSSSTSETVIQARTGADGSYVVENIAPGEYTAAFNKPKYKPKSVYKIVVKPGQQIEIPVTLDPSDDDDDQSGALDRARDEAQRARDEARAAGAPSAAPEEWKAGEAAFDAGEVHEGSGDLADAEDRYKAASKAYLAARDKARRGAEEQRTADAARLSRERDDCTAAHQEAQKAGAQEKQAEAFHAASARQAEAVAISGDQPGAAATKFAEAATLFRQAVASIAASQEASAFAEQAAVRLRALGVAGAAARTAREAAEAAVAALDAGAAAGPRGTIMRANELFDAGEQFGTDALERAKGGAERIAPAVRSTLLEAIDLAVRRYEEARTGFDEAAAAAKQAVARARIRQAIDARKGETTARRAEYEAALAAARAKPGIQLAGAEGKAAKAEAQVTLGAGLAEIALGAMSGGDEGARAVVAYTQAAALYVEAAGDVRAAEAAAAKAAATGGTSADRAAIDRLMAAFKKSYEEKDLETLAALYADLGDKRRSYEALFSDESASYEIKPEAPKLESGDFAYTYYTFIATRSGSAQKPVRVKLMFRKSGGDWKIASQ